MLLADKKKQENISEYIIYMYQTELLIRNFEFDIEKIQDHVLKNIPAELLDDPGRLALKNWYISTIDTMKSEKLTSEGHLSEVQEIVQELSNLSLNLQVENEEYAGVFGSARPYIRASIQTSGGLITDPIQACLNGVFGFLLSRMNDKKIDEDTQKAVDSFGNVLSLLSYHYGNPK